MPHAGLMNEGALGPVEGPLLRARLHLRGGKRRLREGKVSAAVATLYDALSAAMEWAVATPAHRRPLRFFTGENPSDDRIVYRVLVRAGILDGVFDYDAFDRLLERALADDIRDIDGGRLLVGVESVLLQLGVLPFDEASLPPEDPRTF